MTRGVFLASLNLIAKLLADLRANFQIALVTALAAMACASPCLKLAPLDSNQTAGSRELQSFAQETLERLPVGIGRGLQERIAVRWDSGVNREFSAAEAAKLFCAPSGAAHALARSEIKDSVPTLYLHPALKPAVMSSVLVGEGAIPAACSSHKDLRRLAQAALIHQVAHLFAAHSDTSRELLAEFKLSSRSAFLAVDTGRSPDPLEARDAVEHFAVNAEYFVLDPEFACRKPFEMRRLRARIGAPRGLTEHGCTSEWKIGLEKGAQVGISPEQVRELRYLLVESAPGAGPRRGERAGHAMFHLVRCPEGDAACDRDIVVSFRANLMDPMTDTLSGLAGTEPGRVRAYRYGEVVDEYAHSELRSLRSVALELDRGTRERFVALLLERYWADNGALTAGGRNAGNEARDLLKAALGPTHPFWKSSGVSAARVFQDLRRTGLAGKGREILIPSAWSELEIAFERLNRAGGGRWRDLRTYLLTTTALERREWARKLLGGSDHWVAHAEAFDRMETWIRASLERRTQRESVRKLVDYRERGLSRVEAKKLLLKVASLRTYSHEIMPRSQAADLDGYGVPLNHELDSANRGRDTGFAQLAREAEGALVALSERRREQFPAESQELVEVAFNLSWVKEQIAQASTRSGEGGAGQVLSRVPAATRP